MTHSVKSAPQAARDLLAETAVDDANQISFPIDPFEIAKKLKIDVSTSPLADDVAGFIVKKDEDSPVQIVLNSKDGLARQRFTCAHELGHYTRRVHNGDVDLIGLVDYRNEVSGQGSDPEEVWSNSFAAEMLMPSFAMRSYWASGKSISQMASIFGVSKRAMEVRISYLNLV